MDLQNIRSSKALQCPRCDSFHTKFCYYNNYNYSQPRHFCKSCRRYWTIGGVLRNVPVGGGTRKSKNSKPKPKPISDVLSPGVLLAGANSNSRSDFEILMGNCSSERSSVPFALELNELADWYWARGEGFGSLDLSRTGESEISVPGSIESRR